MDVTNKNDYHISFFKPTTPQARRNRNMVLAFVVVWAVAIFGFQILLRVIEKPTKEPALVSFENAWDHVKADDACLSELRDFSASALSVLGKVAIATEDRQVLQNAVSWAAYNMADSVQQVSFKAQVAEFEEIASNISSLDDEAYLAAKVALMDSASAIIGLSVTEDIRAHILPLELKAAAMDSFSDEDKAAIEALMPKYLVHYRSFLTDSTFLGFPFHYFYTAVFLLILFVGLCWLYCKLIDRMNAKLNIVD